jgi:drug/metabolite transporter (DMT)-like permease
LKKFAPLFVIIAASFWGIDGIVLRPELYSLPVTLVVFVESTIVALLLSPFYLTKIRALKNLKTKDWLSFAGVALFGGAIGTLAITKSLFYVNFVNLSIVVLIQKLQPVFALILANILLKEKLPKKFFIWASTAVIGAYVMTFGDNLVNLNTGDKTAEAALFSLIAAFSFASSTVFSKRALRNVDYGLGTYLRFIFSAVILLIIAGSIGDINSFGTVSNHQWMIFFIIAFTSGGLAIFLYYYGLKNISASVATICELAFPLTAIVLEYFIRDNILSLIQWFGVLLLIVSILKVTRIGK